jgi:proteasome accessory factor C
MSTAADRFRRLMALLPRCSDAEELSLTALSQELATTPRELLADLAAVTERENDPPGFLDPVTVLVAGDRLTVRSTHFHRPMRLSAAELCALELGLAVLEREAHGDEARACAALRDKLTRCITTLPQDRVYQGIRDGAFTASHEIDVLSQVRAALRRRVVLVFDYQPAHAPMAESRTLRPYQLIFSRGRWYVAGWCETAGGLRLFRTDRITRIVLTTRPVVVPPDFDPTDLIHNGHPFVTAEVGATFTVRYSPTIARWIAERDGGPVEPDGGAVRTMPLADREWALRHVLQYGPDAVVVSPEDLRRDLVERVGAMRSPPTV